jgi:hypothetical protein
MLIQSGDTYTNWTVLYYTVSKGSNKKVLCRCLCGTTSEVFVSNLRSGKSKSCGCLTDKRETIASASRALSTKNTRKYDIDEFGRKCIVCDVKFPWDHFYFSKTGVNGRSSRCPRCLKDQELRRVFGITIDEYYYLLKLQNNKCALCDQENQTYRSLSVDHDHSCSCEKGCRQCIRGLLDEECNRVLGVLEKKPQLLNSLALQYLSNRPFRMLGRES